MRDYLLRVSHLSCLLWGTLAVMPSSICEMRRTSADPNALQRGSIVSPSDSYPQKSIQQWRAFGLGILCEEVGLISSTPSQISPWGWARTGLKKTETFLSIFVHTDSNHVRLAAMLRKLCKGFDLPCACVILSCCDRKIAQLATEHPSFRGLPLWRRPKTRRRA